MVRAFINEIRLTLTTKNIVFIFACLLASQIIYEAVYVRAYDAYPQKMAESLVMEMDEATFQHSIHDIELAAMKLENPEHPDILPLTDIRALWRDQVADLRNLEYLWRKDPQGKRDDILRVMRQIDRRIARAVESGIDKAYLSETRIYRDDERAWQQRQLLWEAYALHDEMPPVIPNTPTAAFVLVDALGGNSFAYFLLLLLVLFLSYDAWAFDFEHQTIKLLFCQPYSRQRIYWLRLLVRYTVILCVAVLFLLILAINGALRYGGGWTDYGIINQMALSFAAFDNAFAMLLGKDIAVPLSALLFYEALIFLSYSFFVSVVIQLVSYLCKNQLTVLFLSFSIAIAVAAFLSYASTSQNSVYNPLLYFQAGQMAAGALGIGIYLAILLLGAGGCLLAFLNGLMMEHKTDI